MQTDRQTERQTDRQDGTNSRFLHFLGRASKLQLQTSTKTRKKGPKLMTTTPLTTIYATHL
jgi:hypothetical protein